jgi:hypothetical protein
MKHGINTDFTNDVAIRALSVFHPWLNFLVPRLCLGTSNSEIRNQARLRVTSFSLPCRPW